jgi:molybdate transport system regulatory protein
VEVSLGRPAAANRVEGGKNLFKLLINARVMPNKTAKQIRPRLRIGFGKVIALGPGKIELLESLDRTGSITEAAREMKMSYMRAWTLILTMNKCFREPLVVASRGGRKGGGGAQLTASGQQVLKLYLEMNAKCVEAIQSDWKELQTLLR